MPEQLPSGFESLATSRAYFTQESMLAVETRKRKLFIASASRPKLCSIW
jgi:alanine dehydrogenase